MSLMMMEKTGAAQCHDWPQLSQLGLTSSAVVERRQGIGGSDANTILSGDGERLRELWLEKRGDAEPPDLSDRLAVMLGCWTEAFNRQWFERLTGVNVIDSGKRLSCSRREWRHCTLDGFIEAGPAVWEAKHTNGFATSAEVTARYMPQLQHNMAVAGVERGFLSIIFGNHKFEIIEIASDWLYQLELLEAEEHFWDCVQTGREPVAVAPPAPPRPVGTRELCLEGNNAWGAAAADWLDNREAAKVHAMATKTLKELVEEDVARAFGHGIEAKRSKSGAITIREFA
jgi:predicted phage-related endonuclease